MTKQSHTSQQTQKQSKQILRKKQQLIRLWTSIFFSSSHLCFVDFMIAKAHKSEKVHQDNLARFLNYENIIAQLKEGFIIIGTGQKKTYEVNMNIQEVLPNLIERIKNTIKIDKQVYKLNSQKQRICIKCGKSKEIALIQSGFRCQCGFAQFRQIKHDIDKKRRLEKVQQLLDRVITKKQEIQRLQVQLQKSKLIEMESQKQKSSRKISNYKEFINGVAKKVHLQMPKHLPHDQQQSFKELVNRQLAPITEYKRVNQYVKWQQKRKLFKSN